MCPLLVLDGEEFHGDNFFSFIDHTWLLHAFQTEAELENFLSPELYHYLGVDSGSTFPVHSKYAS